jgi:plasmid maintenance system killer protein
LKRYGDALELAFDKKLLRQLCENETRAKRDLGVRVAEKLKRRLADLRAAKCVKDLVAGRPRELDGDRCRHIAVDLCEGCRIVFCANHNTIPELGSGDVDWSKVSRVKIIEIENDHD